jgi:predicted  nucleic acid-binding Zn-ribbon protein
VHEGDAAGDPTAAVSTPLPWLRPDGSRQISRAGGQRHAIQQIREEWIGRAEKQAEQVVMESELKAKQLQVDAERRLESLQHDVQELKRQRHRLVSEIRHILDEHLKVLDTIEEADGESADHQRPLLEISDQQRDVSGADRG